MTPPYTKGLHEVDDDELFGLMAELARPSWTDAAPQRR